MDKSRAVHCAMLIQRQNAVNDNDSIQFMKVNPIFVG